MVSRDLPRTTTIGAASKVEEGSTAGEATAVAPLDERVASVDQKKRPWARPHLEKLGSVAEATLGLGLT